VRRLFERSAAQRSEFSRAPLRASTAREPRAAGRHSRGRLFLPTSFGEAKEVGRPPGRTPGLVMMQGHARWVTRRKGVTAKQQLLLKFDFSLRTSKATTTVLPAPRRVTQDSSTAVEASRESVPAAGSLFCSAKKVTKKGGPDDRALLTQGARASGTRSGARLNSPSCAWLRQTPHLFPLRAPLPRRAQRGLHCHFKSNGNGNGNGNGNFQLAR